VRQIHRELTRQQNVEKARAELAQITSEEKRLTRLVREGKVNPIQ